MKILLVEPNIEGRVGLPSLSLAVLMSFVNKRTKHRAKIVDLSFHKRHWEKYLSAKIGDEKPDIIGISTLTFNYSQSLKIAKYIKSISDIRVILGGVHSILMPEEIIKNRDVDIVCVGEGEYPLKEIMDNDFRCDGVKGVWYKENGNVIKNESRRTIEDLDELPFPEWDDFELQKYFILNNEHLPIMASRGCPYSCTYCSNHALKRAMSGKYVRFRSVDSVIEEIGIRIDQYYKTGLRYFMFYDDIFTMDRDYVLEFCQKYRAEGYHKLVGWCVNVRANLVTDEIIKAMKEAGCYEAAMGIEASDDFIRNKVYKRNMSIEQINNAVAIINKHGMQLRVQFIIGAPYETLDMMRGSFEMAKKINAQVTQFPVLMPLPATDMNKICLKEGLIESDDAFNDPQNMFTKSVIRTKYATRKDVQTLVKKIRNYQIREYFFDGLKRKGPIFIWDICKFFFYYKLKYELEIDNAWKFTINKYNLEKFKPERNL